MTRLGRKRRARRAPSVGWSWWGSPRSWHAILLRHADGRRTWYQGGWRRYLTTAEAIDWRIQAQNAYWGASVALLRWDGARWVRA